MMNAVRFLLRVNEKCIKYKKIWNDDAKTVTEFIWDQISRSAGCGVYQASYRRRNYVQYLQQGLPPRTIRSDIRISTIKVVTRVIVYPGEHFRTRLE